ncbi:MAG: HEAT repeat domain-containing protein [Deltaproteobacteria bacterium]|nr:HEAT repeat domain-containing protein [Deltaproteobacteria bacterium]
MVDSTEIDFDGASLPVLFELLNRPQSQIRADAACAIGDRLRTCELQQLEVHMQEKLAQMLADEAAAVRFEAAITLALAKDKRATDELIKALNSSALRLDAIRALGTSGDERALPTLLNILNRRFLMPWADKLQAAAALCALGDLAGAQYLQEKLASRRMGERAAAIHFLGESKHPQARAILEQLIVDSSEPLRDVAVRAIGLLQDPQVAQVLIETRVNADTELKDDIDQALTKLGIKTSA